MKMTGLGRLSLVLLAVSTLAGGLLGGRVLAAPTRLSDHVRLYSAVLDAIESHYAEDIKSDKLVSGSIREMLRTLDPHSNFLETQDYSKLQEKQKGSYYGLGITVQAIDGNITVVSPFEGTPAYRLGIRAGDIISGIEGEDARGMPIDDAVKRLRGPKGTSVRINIVRQGYDAPLEFTVIRDEIPLHAVPYFFMAAPKAGYIRLQDFNETTACWPVDTKGCQRELEKALSTLLKEGATAIILDIRDNPGGLLNQAFAVSNLFLKKGQLVVSTKGRLRRDESSYLAEGESPYREVPLVVLVSKHSASASEIVAGAIQDHDRGLIVGETTFGKGLVQTIMPLRSSRGYALALTTARYYTPSGRLIQRDYGATTLDDYYSPPKPRRGCDDVGSDAKVTEAGRKVYGGDGITPDYCVGPPTPSKFMAYLLARQAFIGFSRGFAPAETNGKAEIAGAGSRPDATTGKVKTIGLDFKVDDAVLAEFRTYLDGKKLKYTEEDLGANREALVREITEEVLKQGFGEGAARRRSLAWDLQFQRALELVPKAEQLLKDPQRFVEDQEASKRLAAGGRQ